MSDVTHILDPEFVIPSAEDRERLAFWERMDKVAMDAEPRLGPSTLKALLELMSSLPGVVGLSEGDFWGIVAKYVHRGIPAGSGERNVCDEHLRMDYRPSRGAFSNIDLLVDDLRGLGDHQRVALYTLAACWEGGHEECRRCRDSRISTLTAGEQDLIWDSRAKAAVRRTAYLEQSPTDLSNLESSASFLFPLLEFAPDAWRNIRDLVGGTEENLRKLLEHLGVLNDHAPDIWRENTSTEDRQARLSGYGVASSPESPQTHRNQKAMRMRDFEFDSGTVRCEWHTKLRPTVNRIHFAVVDGRVLVGAIVSHLKT